MPSQDWPDTTAGRLLRTLESHYGAPRQRSLNSFEMIVWEIVAYLADDSKREKAFAALAAEVGVTPQALAEATPEALVRFTRMGGSIAAADRAERLRTAARIVLDSCGGDLDAALRGDAKRAKRLLMGFPMIGEPGAAKILLFQRLRPELALDSNGLRVVLRLGFGTESKNYAHSYNSVRTALAPELPGNYSLLMAAHQLLRTHGQELCTRTNPACDRCPVRADCPFRRSA